MTEKPVAEKKKQNLGGKVKAFVARKAIERELRKIEQKQELSSFDDDDAPSSGGKSQLVALLLVIFVGGLGIHRFYLGYTTIGIIQLLTLGGCGIWALIDLIRIVTGDLKPKNGNYTETL
ncbi:MAG: TM2 domain-containing protein [Saprospiraceae bacterium]|nr:TM2 domain-containing protein [Saprospiraceae bacterium]